MTVHTWQPGMFERPCGGCTMCCRLPAIEPCPQVPGGKPPGKWCDHCTIGVGCKIHEDRPEGCKSFMCAWKITPGFPEELRPDRCKVIWHMSSDGTKVAAITEYPRMLENAAQRRVAETFAAQGLQVVVVLP